MIFMLIANQRLLIFKKFDFCLYFEAISTERIRFEFKTLSVMYETTITLY
jgi:hypothetical protein